MSEIVNTSFVFSLLESFDCDLVSLAPECLVGNRAVWLGICRNGSTRKVDAGVLSEERVSCLVLRTKSLRIASVDFQSRFVLCVFRFCHSDPFLSDVPLARGRSLRGQLLDEGNLDVLASKSGELYLFDPKDSLVPSLFGECKDPFPSVRSFTASDPSAQHVYALYSFPFFQSPFVLKAFDFGRLGPF